MKTKTYRCGLVPTYKPGNYLICTEKLFGLFAEHFHLRQLNQLSDGVKQQFFKTKIFNLKLAQRTEG